MIIKKLWDSATLCLITTSLWLVLMIVSISNTGAIITIEEAIGSVMNPGILFYLSYINAVFVTITATVFFVYLYSYCKSLNSEWSLMGMVFVPVYCILNLLVYFSQIAVIPRLISLMNTQQHSEVYIAILGQFIQGWSGSAVSVMNQLAYAVLGIPSVIFGIILVKHKRISTLGGWLLVLNGLSCIVGVIGTAANSQALAIGSVVGGALFLFSLAVIVVRIYSGRCREAKKRIEDKNIRL